MRTTLSTEKVRRNENSIINLNNAEESGTHWVACAKKENCAIYFKFWQSSTTEGIDAIFRKQRDAN